MLKDREGSITLQKAASFGLKRSGSAPAFGGAWTAVAVRMFAPQSPWREPCRLNWCCGYCDGIMACPAMKAGAGTAACGKGAGSMGMVIFPAPYSQGGLRGPQ